MPDQSMTITGTLGKDPELNYTASGVAMTKFSVAVNKRWPKKDQPGEWGEETTWFNVICWRNLAENVAASVQKGNRVTVVGEIKTHKWEDKETGATRYGWDLQADEVAPSLRWATAQVEETEREKWGGE